MTDHDDGFQGYVKAKLEDIGRNQGEQWSAINGLRDSLTGIRVDLSSLKASAATTEDVTALAQDVSSLKATARAWGAFAGIIAGVVTTVTGRLWK